MVGSRAIPLLLMLVVVACERVSVPDDVVPPVAPPKVEAIPAPWSDAELREVVDLQVARDGEALRARLSADDPRVRARAALALASVQHTRAAGELAALLDDPDPAVRREAAFALGQVQSADRGAALMEALARETDPTVRRRIIEALGKRAGPGGVEALLEHEPEGAGEEAELALALSRAALRGVEGEALMDALADRLEHSDPEVRRNAAYYFGRTNRMGAWTRQVERVRGALDGYDAAEPAAMHLVAGLGLRRAGEDRDRLLEWLRGARDWRVRANAARALGSADFLDSGGVEAALLQRMAADPSLHVATAAADALTMGGSASGGPSDAMTRVILDGPPSRWQAHLPFVEYAADRERLDLVLHWTRRMAGEHPAATARGVRLLGRPVEAEGVATFLQEMLEHRDDGVRAAAVTSLAERWTAMPTDEADFRRLLERFEELLDGGPPPVVVAVTRVLSSTAWIPFGSRDLLARGLAGLDSEAPVLVLLSYLEALAGVGGEDAVELVEGFLEHPHPRVRAAAGRAHEVFTGRRPEGTRLADPERTVDWEALEALGGAPRLHLETERGEIVVRLAPAHAPLTVQVVAEMVGEGRYDGTRFHRVLPNFVLQGGDFTLGNGSGSPGFAMRSEFTRVPFRRGTLGMASSGKDTEGSQFFLTHSMQPHLDGSYTAFGWVESGAEAMDAVLEGDRIRRARVEPGEGE